MTPDAGDEQATPHVLALCSRSGNILRPWARAGYGCIAVDAKTTERVERVGDGHIRYVQSDVRDYSPPGGECAFACAFPPCTHLAVSGARWFQQKGLRTLADAIDVVGACVNILDNLDCPWFVENPVSTLSTHWREPDHRFNPFQFQGYTDRDEAYTKETCLWVGNGFRMPRTDSGGISVDQADDRIHKMPPSDERSEKRAETPRGFAIAVFLAQTQPERFAATDGREQMQLTEVR